MAKNSGEHVPTQYEVAKTHIAKLESLMRYLRTLGKDAEITVCPNCNRDAVKVKSLAHGIYMYIDDCDFMGTHWRYLALCETTTTGMFRSEFKHWE